MSQRKFVYRGNYYLHTKLFLPLNSAQFLFLGGGAHQPPQSDFAGKITWGKKFLMGNYSYLALLLKFGRINRLVLSAYPTTICVATSLHATLDSPL
jgi:hypothetical protein